MRGWEMRWRILIMQSEGDEGGICVVTESCHQTSEGIGLMASIFINSWCIYHMVTYLLTAQRNLNEYKKWEEARLWE